jgi:peptidoglycan biosynthesis protein MviN/MurJ (putative lipid II flippase)
VLLQGLAVAGAIQQLGFNWFSFYRARGETRPPAVEAIVGALGFLALAVPGLLIDGSDGFVVGRVAAVVISTGVRWFYIRRLLPGVRAPGVLAPALVPLALAVVAVLALRLATWSAHRDLWQALAEAALFTGVYGISVWHRERALIGELLTALR